RRDHAQRDALEPRWIAGGAMVNDDVLVAFATDDVDRRLHLAEHAAAGIELNVEPTACRFAKQRIMIEIGGGDLDRVAAERHDEVDLVVEQDGTEEGEAEAFAVLLEFAPLALRQGAAAQNVVERLGDGFGAAARAVD